MSSLLCLPNEMLHDIANKIPPYDLDNFTMSCKHIRGVCDDLLEEHQSCKRLYGSLVFDRCSETKIDSIFAVLETLSLKPQLIHYIKAVKFLDKDDRWRRGGPYRSDSDEATQEQDRDIAERTAGFHQLVLASPLIQAKEEWCQAIESGKDECAFALLLSMLANLRTLTIMLPDEGTLRYIDALVKSISHLQHHGARASSALAKLHGLKFVQVPSELAKLDAESLLNWVNLGTLRHLCLSHVSWITSETCQHIDLSRIESLDLQRCELGIECLDFLFKIVPMLKDFRYQWGKIVWDYRDSHLDEVCSLLSEYFSTTLRRLVLLTASWPTWYIGPLFSFTNLKMIGLDLALFNNDEYDNPEKPADLLPPSVRNIQFRNDLGCDISRSFWDQLKDLKTPLPNVVSLQLCGDWSIDTSDIEAKCKQAGIHFELVPDTSD